VFVVFESNIGGFKFAAAFDVDGSVRINQDVGDGWITEQRLQRPQPEEFVLNIVYEPVAFRTRERHCFLRQYGFRQARNLGMDLIWRQRSQLGQIHAIDERAVQPRLHFLKGMSGVQPVAICRAGTAHRLSD